MLFFSIINESLVVSSTQIRINILISWFYLNTILLTCLSRLVLEHYDCQWCEPNNIKLMILVTKVNMAYLQLIQ